MAKYLKPQTPLQHQSGDYIYPITTIDQVLMDNGERLNANIINIQLDGAPEDNINFGINADTLGGQKPEYYATAEDLAALNDSRLSMELLWENASPTSAFAEQDLALDLSAFNLCAVEVRCSDTINAKIPLAIMKTDVNNEMTTCNVWADAGSFYHRSFLRTSSGLHVGAGKANIATGTNVLIPIRIYGIKGVHA